MKNYLLTAAFFIAGIASFSAKAQQSNVVNQYGPPNFTGGTVNSPNESFAIYREQRAQENPITTIQRIYPDPAQNISNIVLAEKAARPVTLYIVNLSGTIMRTYNYDGGNTQLTFDVSELQNGVYTIQVQEEGKSMQSIKLLKQS